MENKTTENKQHIWKTSQQKVIIYGKQDSIEEHHIWKTQQQIKIYTWKVEQ